MNGFIEVTGIEGDTININIDKIICVKEEDRYTLIIVDGYYKIKLKDDMFDVMNKIYKAK